MNNKYLFIIIIFFIPSLCWSATEQPEDKTLIDSPKSHLISFQYDNEELVNVVNYIATKKKINMLFPTKTDDKLAGTLTWHLDKKVTIDQAWELLQTILRIAGYAIIPRPTYYEIVKTSPAISREPVPLYVGTMPDKLPLGDEQIRYIYYLINIKSETEVEGEIDTVLKAILPTNALFKIDKATNALILMGRANDIHSAMSLVLHLDRPGFQEHMHIIKLHYTNAQMIADLFNNKILQANDVNRYRLDTKKPSDASYFSKHIKIIANERTNSLIILGRIQALERIAEFINHYIDVEPDSGKSLLHVYQLQYLDAVKFASVLNNIVQSGKTGGTEQATAEQKTATGPQRYFDEIIISVDTPPEGAESVGETKPENGAQTQKYYGGNKLIIAARRDDWKRIKTLIEKLDQPSPQVLIEVLIADLTLDDSRALGTLFRNPGKIPMPGQVNFQSAQLDPGVMPDSFANPQTIGAIDGGPATDLLRQFDNTNPRKDTGDPLTNVAQLLAAGSSVISFSDNDGKTWGITQILNLLDHTKILSHPHVISTNNQVATIETTEIRLLRDKASGSQGGTIVQTRKSIPASLKVNIVPRISISDIRSSTVALNVIIDIDEYKSTNDNTRITRKIKTNATVNTGDILALGGLIRSNESDAVGETPVLSKIPVIGWLFKRRSRSKQRTNLTVFISPTIIEPRFRTGIKEYTQDYLNISKGYASPHLFDSLKDPITRWFFHEESPTKRFTRDFMKHDEEYQQLKMPAPQLDESPQPLSNNLLVEQHNEQLNQLKDILKDVDNPFKDIAPASVAQNTVSPVIKEAPKKGRKRRR